MNKFQKSISAIAAIVLLVTVTMLTFAFKAKDVSRATPSTWHFIGNTNLEIYDQTKWLPGASSDADCKTDIILDLPCTLTVTSEDIADVGELEDYLNFYYFGNPVGVRNAAQSTKPIE